MGFSSYNYGIFSVAQFSKAVVARQTFQKITKIVIDSRKVDAQSLFVCLTGGRADAHSYIEDAINKGASAIMVDKKHADEAVAKSRNSLCGVLVVNNTLKALQTLSKNYVAQFSQINYSGITGSCGKSTTKQALAALLSQEGNTVYTPGNFNSEIGLALSLLNCDASTEFGVFEMGIDRIGEMDRHLYMVKPSQALITNIGFSHLEKFGSRKTIAKEKGKIFHSSLEMGFVSNRCDYKSFFNRKSVVPLNSYSNADLSYISRGLLGYDVYINNELIRVPVLGEHQIEDIAGAITVARSMGLCERQIADGLRQFEPMEGRGSINRGKITVIEDCYNASPSSTSSMLGYLESVSWNGSKKVVLGDMKELGKEAKKGHTQVAKSIFGSHPTSSFLYGKEMYSAYKYLKSENYQGQLFYSDNFDEINDAVDRDKREGDLFLLKGSRLMEVERFIPTLRGAL
jgi:UDP-N-acetylmuramoyl-tripeptide--D-alanyl-D-alanine ligase